MTTPATPPTSRSRRGLIAALIAAALTPLSARAGDNAHPVVVELFTSQGCSSCPPANANLARLSNRPDVLALSFGVTYWDYLGWKDSFAQPAFTERQKTYERALGHGGPFTPQMVVGGRADVVGNDLSEIERLIGRAGRPKGPGVALGAHEVSVGAAPAPRAGVDVWLVRYDPRTVQVPVRRGENGGKTLPHKNVVHDLVRLGGWEGQARSFRIAPAPPGLATAFLVQTAHGGPILAAARG
jgi:hypothetical protein